VTDPRLSAVDAKLLATLERAFDAHAGHDAHIDLAELQKALGLRSEYLARRVLLLFDSNRDGVVSKEEFLAGARTLLLGSDRDKLWFAFRLYDHDGDGFLDHHEVMRMLSMTLAEDEIVERAKQPVEQLARVFLKAADRNADGRVSFERERSAKGARRRRGAKKVYRSLLMRVS